MALSSAAWPGAETRATDGAAAGEVCLAQSMAAARKARSGYRATPCTYMYGVVWYVPKDMGADSQRWADTVISMYINSLNAQ